VEMPSGHQWLQRLVWAVVYVFGVKHGIGNDTLSEFFQLLRLERHIGYRLAPCVRVKLERQILSYHRTKAVAASPNKVEVCVGADETLFEQMVLATGPFIRLFFLEAQAKDRSYQTWQDATGAPFSR